MHVRGLGARLERVAEAHARVELDGRGLTAGPFDWFLLHTAPRFPLIGHVLRISSGTLVTAAAGPCDETWELMRGYGIVAGSDRVAIADHDYTDGRQQPERAALFQRDLPRELREHNELALNAIRMVGAQALDTRLRDLHEVWDALAAWEGPVREHAETEEFIRAYAAPGSGWPRSQSKSSPSIVWIGEHEGNRPQGYLEGLAGAYHPERDLLEVNADFPSFRALQAFWQEQYLPLAETSPIGPPSQVIETVSEVVREWCEQTLVEVVVGVNQLAGRPGWDEARVRAALSPEALSGAALAIHHVQQSIKRSLGQRLGSLKETKTM